MRVLISFMLVVTAIAAGSDADEEDNWYVVQMGADGQVVGRMHTSVKVVQAEQGSSTGAMVQSTEALEVVLQRGADRSAMFIETEVVEDRLGVQRRASAILVNHLHIQFDRFETFR